MNSWKQVKSMKKTRISNRNPASKTWMINQYQKSCWIECEIEVRRRKLNFKMCCQQISKDCKKWRKWKRGRLKGSITRSAESRFRYRIINHYSKMRGFYRTKPRLLDSKISIRPIFWSRILMIKSRFKIGPKECHQMIAAPKIKVRSTFWDRIEKIGKISLNLRELLVGSSTARICQFNRDQEFKVPKSANSQKHHRHRGQNKLPRP